MGDEMLSYECFLDLAVILIAAKLFGILFRKLHLPQVVGVLVAGLIIGPNVLGLVSESDFLVTMAELGVIMLMFTAGLETDLKELMHTGPAALCIASFGVLVPLIGGYLLHAAIYGFAPIGSDSFFQSLFIGVIITATSVSITVETLREMGKLKGKVGTTILSAAIIDDVIGIVILTFVIGLKNPDSAPFTVIFNTVSFFVVAGLVGFLINALFRKFDAKYGKKRRIPIYGFALCLLFAYIAEKYFGIADITGAYVAGIVLCNIRSSEYIVQKIDTSSYMIFSPIFFTSIGIKTKIAGVTPTVLLFVVGFIVVALLSKALGCFLGAKLFRFQAKDALRIGAGMMARGEVALIIAQKGLAANLLDPVLFTAVIFLVLISSITTPIVLKLLYKGSNDETVDHTRLAHA